MAFRRWSARIKLPVDWNVPLHAGCVDVHAGFKLDVEAQYDPKAGPRNVVTGRRRDLEVLGLGNAPCRNDAGAELPGQNIGSRDAVCVVVFEVLRYDSALNIHDILSRIRDSENRCVWSHCLIKNAVGADDFRICIGEKWIRNMLPISKILQRTYRVVTNRYNSEPLFP